MNKFMIVPVGVILLHVSVLMAKADGLSPILDPKEYRQTLPGMPAPTQIPVVGTLMGSIQTTDGRPLSGGKLHIFNADKGPPPATEKYLRVPDETVSLDGDGGFSVDLLPGRYYIGAIQGGRDKPMSALPSEGEIYYDGKDSYEVLPGSINNINVIKGGKQFLMDMSSNVESLTSVEGVVLDMSGKPVENAVVFAYTKVEMNGRPMFVSERSDKSGAYRLLVAGAGTFFLRVSNDYVRGMSAAGKVIGVYGGDNPKAVIVQKGEVIKNLILQAY